MLISLHNFLEKVKYCLFNSDYYLIFKEFIELSVLVENNKIDPIKGGVARKKIGLNFTGN
jgi:hypothetical protein